MGKKLEFDSSDHIINEFIAEHKIVSAGSYEEPVDEGLILKTKNRLNRFFPDGPLHSLDGEFTTIELKKPLDLTGEQIEKAREFFKKQQRKRTVGLLKRFENSLVNAGNLFSSKLSFGLKLSEAVIDCDYQVLTGFCYHRRNQYVGYWCPVYQTKFWNSDNEGWTYGVGCGILVFGSGD